jgi:5-methylcytosine-specific restriction protein A
MSNNHALPSMVPEQGQMVQSAASESERGASAERRETVTAVATYLLTWNPGRYEWKDFQEDWEAVYLGSRPRFEWSCGNTKKIAVGDRVFMMRLGWREHITGMLASGWVTGEPVQGEHWSEKKEGATAPYVEFEPDVLLNPGVDELLDPTIVSSSHNWRPQSSGTAIPQDIAQRLEEAWQEHLQGLGTESQASRENISASCHKVYKEGTSAWVSGYRYERDPRAREACIRHYGASCAVCGFDFGAAYGEIGEGFIHVHHRQPLADSEEEYDVDPVADLRPVCPNCHAMLHRQSPPLTISELKARIDTEKVRRRRGAIR